MFENLNLSQKVMPSITQTKKEYKTPITSEFTKSLSKIFFSADLIAKQMETSVTNINSIGELIEIRPIVQKASKTLRSSPTKAANA